MKYVGTGKKDFWGLWKTYISAGVRGEFVVDDIRKWGKGRDTKEEFGVKKQTNTAETPSVNNNFTGNIAIDEFLGKEMTRV